MDIKLGSGRSIDILTGTCDVDVAQVLKDSLTTPYIEVGGIYALDWDRVRRVFTGEPLGTFVWDKPESTFRPAEMFELSRCLRKYADRGATIHIVSYDYLLLGEMSLVAEYDLEPSVDLGFVSLYTQKGSPEVLVEYGEDMPDVAHDTTLDAMADHYDRERVLFYGKYRPENKNT